ncbi:hypothetical protein ACFV1N_25095 [Streptosporangium canum]|uniref:hypothetical protein n=1 Tax=Streptosporangium canum TaxID=324952 RepID=UPI0036AB22C4
MRPTGDDAPDRNHSLIYWQEQAGLNNCRLARELQELAQAHGDKNVHPDARRVRAWRHGERPRDPVPELLLEVLRRHLGRHLTLAHIGLDPAATVTAWPGTPWVSTHTVTEIINCTRSDLMLGRRDVINHNAAVLTGDDLLRAVQPWTTATPDPLDMPSGHRHNRIGLREVTQIHAVTAALRELDNLHGGGLAREAVIGQLTWAASLLRDATYTEKVGRKLYAAVGELASVAGWMSHDCGMHAAAQHYFLLGLRSAKEAGDANLGAHLLNCMARQAGHQDRPQDALELVHLALYGARNTATPTIRAILHSLEARSYAVMGRPDFDRAAGLAEDAFARSASADDPPWVGFFDASEYYATLGVCYQIAARQGESTHATRSISMIEQAIALRAEGRIRSKTFDLIGLARAHLAARDPDGAVAATNSALELMAFVDSTRVHDRLRELLDETAPYAGTSALGDLQARITTRLDG